MSDIGIFFTGTQFDLQVADGDLCRDDGLETAVIISLFTDQRVSVQELPAFKESRRGWWADAISEIEGDQIGSKLWLLEREKSEDQILNAWESFATDALQWMIEDGLASRVSAIADFSQGDIIVDIEITKPDDSDIRLSFLWDGQELRRG